MHILWVGCRMYLSASAFPESDAIGFEDKARVSYPETASARSTPTPTPCPVAVHCRQRLCRNAIRPDTQRVWVDHRCWCATDGAVDGVVQHGCPRRWHNPELHHQRVDEWHRLIRHSGVSEVRLPRVPHRPGIPSGGAAQIYSVAAQFNASGTPSPTTTRFHRRPVGYGLVEVHAAAETEDSVGTLGGSVYQIYSAPGTLASTGSLSATARMYQTTAQPANIAWDPGWETSGNSTAFAHGGTKSILVTGDHTYYLSAGTSFNGNGWTCMDCTGATVHHRDMDLRQPGQRAN